MIKPVLSITRCLLTRTKAAATALSVAAAALLAGCHGAAAPDAGVLRQAAVSALADVLENTPRPVTDSTMTDEARRKALLAQYQLQAQALEVISEFPAIVQSQWIGRALNSPSDGVRYSALLTVGRLADYQDGRFSKPYLARANELVNDVNDYLKLAAGFALFKLTKQTDAIARAPRYLDLRSSDPEEDRDLARLRIETLFVLSLMPELDPTELLRSAAADPNSSVQLMAHTRLALLGDKKALNQVINTAQSPNADDQLDALQALGQAKLDDLEPLRQCLQSAQQEEVRMAAARALGLHGDNSGQSLAMKWLSFRDPEKLRPHDLRRDPLHAYRVRFLAALALGAIGDYEQSAGPLLEVIRDSPSRRFQLAASRAALELLVRSGRWDGGQSAPASPPAPPTPPAPAPLSGP